MEIRTDALKLLTMFKRPIPRDARTIGAWLNIFQDLNGRLLNVNKAAPRGSRAERPPQAFGPSSKIYVGNLSWGVDDGRLEQVFSEHGKVVEAKVIYDRESGRFVTMSSETEVNDAIAALDGHSLDGREIKVNVAEQRPRHTSFY